MKTTNHYSKIVEWSEEDQCYIGTCPSLMLGGCHGQDELEVFINNRALNKSCPENVS